MNNDKENDKMSEIMIRFKKNMKAHIGDGTFNHRVLEEQLSDVMKQLSQEAQKSAGELLTEANAEKKTASAPTVGEKQE